MVVEEHDGDKVVDVIATSPAEQVAEVLLRIGAVQLRPQTPFRFASGMLSPIYTDNRLLCSTVVERRLVVALFASLIAQQDLHVDVVAGTATAGIPHAAWLAERLDLPMVYVRGGAKDHGTGKRVEGRVLQGQRVVMVEDLCSTGRSAVEGIGALREETRATVSHCLAIVTYGFQQAADAFAAIDVTPLALTDFDTIVRVAAEQGLLPPNERELALDWRRDPATWAARAGFA